MKKKIFGFIAVSCLGLFACNNDDSTTTTTTDSSSTTGAVSTDTGSTSVNASANYDALAAEFETNNAANRYMDARTGKPIKLGLNRSTGARINATTNEPVTRYIMVDNNDWWAYDAEGTRLGKARMENNKVMYDNNGQWVDYDVMWKDDEVKTNGVKITDDKIKADGIKVKTDKDGDVKIVTDDQKIKIDKDGKTKVKDN